MEIRYECNADDYAEGQIAHSKKQAIYYAFLFLGVLALVIGVALFPKVGVAVSVSEFLFAAVFLLWPLVFLPVHAKRDFKKHPHMAGAKLMRVSEEGLAIESSYGKSENKWSLFSKFRETQRVVLLYVGARNFMIIPKRVFSPEELNEFRALVNRKLAGR